MDNKEDTKNDNELSLSNLLEVIKECEYINKCTSNKKRDEDSFSYLVTDIVLSQSDCIKLGNGFEKLLLDIIIKHTNLKNIKPKNKKGEKERDHLFIDDINKIIYYAELKANLNLDTEKSKSTYQKCLLIEEELKKEYSDYTIKWCLLGYRYFSQKDMKKIIISKYENIKNNLYGINEYFEMLNIPFKFTNETYKIYINSVAKEMFSDNS